MYSVPKGGVGLHPMFPSNFTNKGFLCLSFLNKFLCENILFYVLITPNNHSTSNESKSTIWNGLHLVLLGNFQNTSFLDLSFFKKLICEDILPYVLITLNNQSTFYETNSAWWNEQHPVSSSNFTKQRFLCLSFLKKFFREDALYHVLDKP